MRRTGKSRIASWILMLMLVFLMAEPAFADSAEAADPAVEAGISDGTYAPDSFSFSGGTGKLQITCDQIIVRGGKTYARIIFSSTYIQYVKAGGQKITDYTRGASSTAFVIPAELNKNNTIYALTTKMSQPHEIQYTLFIGLEAAKTAGSGSGSDGNAADCSENNGSASGQTEGNVSDQYDELDQNAPEIMGLTYEKELPVENAKLFKIYLYQDGYTLLEMDMESGTALDKDLTGIEVKTEEDSGGDTGKDSGADAGVDIAEEEDAGSDMTRTASEQKAALYTHPVYKYLIIPEGAEIPAGIDKQLFVVQMPADRTAVASAEALKMMEALDLSDQISGIGVPEDQIENEDPAEAMRADDDESPEIANIGTFDDPDYKTLLLGKTNLFLESGEILPHIGSLEGIDAESKEAFAGLSDEDKEAFTELVKEQKERLATIGKRGVQLNMPVIVDRSADEEDETAKIEWAKVYGILYGIQEEADKLYQEAGGTSQETPEESGGAEGSETAVKILNLRMKLESIPQEETKWEKPEFL